MSDYARQHDFSAKTGTTIFGSEVDDEFDALVTAVASKTDESREGAANGIATLDGSALVPVGVSGTPALGGGQIPEASATSLGAVELATELEAEALTDPLRVITAETLGLVFVDKNYITDGAAGILADLGAQADPAAHVLFGWDNTNNAAEPFLNATNGGIAIGENTVAVNLNDLATETVIEATDFVAMVDATDSGSDKITFANLEAALNHDNLTGFVALEHLDWTADQGASNINDANIAESNVTQHEAALAIGVGQITEGIVSQVDAEAGTDTTGRVWTAERVGQAIAAQGKDPAKGCRVHNSATQSPSNSGTYVRVTWDTESYDTDSYHDPASSPNDARITIPTGVTKVRLTAQLQYGNNSEAGMRAFKIRKNGADGAIDDSVLSYQPLVSAYSDGTSGATTGMFLDSGIITVEAGDYFEIWAMAKWSTTPPSLPAYDSYFACEEVE